MATVLTGSISSPVLAKRVILESFVLKRSTYAILKSPVSLDGAYLRSTLTPVCVILVILG